MRARPEWEPPYSLYGDSGAENLTGEDLPAGSYDLKATAYRKNGDELGTLKVSFTVAYADPAEEQPPAQNTLATGAPTIDGIARVGETLTADTSGIDYADELTNAVFTYQWLRGDTDIAGATGDAYTLVAEDEGQTIQVNVIFTDAEGNPETLTSAPTAAVVNQDTCPDGGYAPAPVEVAVSAVPIVVESTTDEYFVLYVRHELDTDTTVELPVLVKKGEAGTTTLAENVGPLPMERYRVEKYLIADPADVDGDCIDDITELGDPVSMNPVNSAGAIELNDGAVALPDLETFETLSADFYGRDLMVKFVLFGLDTASPGIYFMNSRTHLEHYSFPDVVGLEWGEMVRGYIIYDPDLVAPGGSPGAYRYGLAQISNYSIGEVVRLYALLAASMTLLEDNLILYVPNGDLPYIQSSLPRYNESRINLVFDDDIYPDTEFLALNPGQGYGLLRVMELDERPNPRDIVLYEALPNELPRVAGIVSTVPQTPLSHVNLRAVQDGVPNAFIRGALDNADIDDLIGSYVHYTVTEDGYSIRTATPAEVEAHYAASRPYHRASARARPLGHRNHLPQRHRFRRLGCVRRQSGQLGRAADAGLSGWDRPRRLRGALLFLRRVHEAQRLL